MKTGGETGYGTFFFFRRGDGHAFGRNSGFAGLGDPEDDRIPEELPDEDFGGGRPGRGDGSRNRTVKEGL